MHIAIDKTRDQDPPCNRRKHPPHSVLTYKEKNPTNHTYNHVEVKQFVVEGKGKIKTLTRLKFTCILQFKWWVKIDITERIFRLYSPQGIVTCGVTPLGPETGLGAKAGGSWGRASWEHVAGGVSPKWTWSSFFPLEKPHLQIQQNKLRDWK